MPLRTRRAVAGALGILLVIGFCCPFESAFGGAFPGEEALDDAGWRLAVPGWTYEFPRDHFAHPEFRTEWWYFTGHLQTVDTGGKGPSPDEYGFQITFFRNGLIAPPQRAGRHSRFLVGDIKFGHMALTDLSSHTFRYHEVLTRGAFGEAQFAAGPGKGEPVARLKEWQLDVEAGGVWRAGVHAPEFSLRLTLEPLRPPVFHGRDGVSQKNEGLGEATHYYTIPRMKASGVVRVEGVERPVYGSAWLDREWGSSQLGADQVGWDWFSLNLDDGRDLMIYRLRREDGSSGGNSSGTLMLADGSTTHLTGEDFKLEPVRTWQSSGTGGVYPVSWRVTIPAHGIALEVNARVDAQELVFPAVNYWEGAVTATGESDGRAVTGKGYLEMTGYAGAVRALQGGSR